MGTSSTQDEIKKAYHDKMKICHPDIAGDDGTMALKVVAAPSQVMENWELRVAVPKFIPANRHKRPSLHDGPNVSGISLYILGVLIFGRNFFQLSMGVHHIGKVKKFASC